MTLPEILKEFEDWCKNELVELTDEQGNKIVYLMAVNKFLTQTYTSMVQAEVERLEGLKQECIHKKNWDGKTQIQPCNCVFKDIGGYNLAIEDQINYWKNKLK
jgi:hypothetical protein